MFTPCQGVCWIRQGSTVPRGGCDYGPLGRGVTVPAGPGTQGGTGQRRGRHLKSVLRILRRPAPLLLSAFVIGSLLFLFLGGDWWPRPYGFFEGTGKEDPDATVLVSTLIVVYTFFVAAYGALTPLVVGKGNPFEWDLIKKLGVAFCRASTLVLIALAVGLDLARIANSIGDLYTTTMRALPPLKVADAAAEFVRYLIVNTIILLFALIIGFWPDGSPDDPRRSRPSRTRPPTRPPDPVDDDRPPATQASGPS
jgi:hypothetical protein